ncbi:metalloprotease [Candidatus Pacearchaeota archaeon CG_4_9_14_0_2_um_filter_39_13]|nr:metalloprotease [Candidatus Pacearchaeota archaeon]OIO42868.1 MAG: hypothetical protein AUJ64_03460 [Candidatus Pacearchaeota archaeon CG1_02_39_14]PJC44615.1 MAG: metalloprotease [Candidatus Pacearchaeota archaeon CG_4_9_14_0_2_um_filter_39_13]
MRFSQREIKDLFFAWILISLAFAILFSGGYNDLFFGKQILSVTFLYALIASFVTAGIGFVLHELAHKYVSQGYGLWAEFKAFYNMLFLAIAFSLAGFIIAAPGAVMIHGMITREKNGKISLAGPVANFILGILFLGGMLFFSSGLLGVIMTYGLRINALLAIFNMIPFGAFDGAKIIVWNKGVYWVSVALFLGLFLFSFFI